MYKAAESTPYTASWWTDNKSFDTELKLGSTLQTLVARSRQLLKDNPVAATLQQGFLVSIVGSGPEVYFVSESRLKQKRLNEVIESFLTDIDVTGLKSLDDILEEIVGCSFSDGDLLISLPMVDVGGTLQTKVEIIESHRIRTPQGRSEDERDGLLRNGVAYNRQGQVLGYWVLNADKVDSGSSSEQDFTYYPVYREADGYRRKVTIMFKALSASRPLASRQVPMTTPLMMMLKMLDDFYEAVLIGARVAACFSAFVTLDNPVAGRKAMTTGKDGEQLTSDGKPYSTLKPGAIFYLRKGETVNFADPNKPSDNTDSLTLRCYKTFASALRMPYVLAFLDTEAVSYSSWRGAVVERDKNVNRWRKRLSSIVKWIVYTKLAEAEASGELKASDSNSALFRLRWPASGVLDPEKENRANHIALMDGTTSKQTICDEHGVDFDDVIEDRLTEQMKEDRIYAQRLANRKKLEAEFGVEMPDIDDSGATLAAPSESSSNEEDDPDDMDKNSDTSKSESAKEKRKTNGSW